MKASVELTGPNFIDVHVPHPLGGPQSKWKESNILLHKLYEQKRAFFDVYKLAAAVATFGGSAAILSSFFCFVAYIDTPQAFNDSRAAAQSCRAVIKQADI